MQLSDKVHEQLLVQVYLVNLLIMIKLRKSSSNVPLRQENSYKLVFIQNQLCIYTD